jgi:hypothetical protein
MISVEKILLKAADIIDAGWTQRAEARDKSGEVVDPMGPAATNFCAIGAVRRAAWNDQALDAALNALRDEIGTSGLGNWNDSERMTGARVAAAMRATARRYRDCRAP